MDKTQLIQIDNCYIVVFIVGMNQWKEVIWLITDFLPNSQVVADS